MFFFLTARTVLWVLFVPLSRFFFLLLLVLFGCCFSDGKISQFISDSYCGQEGTLGTTVVVVVVVCSLEVLHIIFYTAAVLCTAVRLLFHFPMKEAAAAVLRACVWFCGPSCSRIMHLVCIVQPFLVTASFVVTHRPRNARNPPPVFPQLQNKCFMMTCLEFTRGSQHDVEKCTQTAAAVRCVLAHVVNPTTPRRTYWYVARTLYVRGVLGERRCRHNTQMPDRCCHNTAANSCIIMHDGTNGGVRAVFYSSFLILPFLLVLFYS